MRYKKHNEFLPNQKKKPTQKPTLMWVCTLFSSIMMINMPDKCIVMNVYPLHQKIILLLGETAKKIYLLPEKMMPKRY